MTKKEISLLIEANKTGNMSDKELAIALKKGTEKFQVSGKGAVSFSLGYRQYATKLYAEEVAAFLGNGKDIASFTLENLNSLIFKGEDSEAKREKCREALEEYLTNA